MNAEITTLGSDGPTSAHFDISNSFMGQSSRTDLTYWDKAVSQRPSNQHDASTAFSFHESLSGQFRSLFRHAAEDSFEDGIENDFSRSLLSAMRTHNEEAVEVLATLVTGYRVNEEIAAEAIRCLGRLESSPSHVRRLWLLERCLYSGSLRIKDAALLALASLDDPHAIPYLRGAIEFERCEELKADMEAVLEQLERTLQCR